MLVRQASLPPVLAFTPAAQHPSDIGQIVMELHGRARGQEAEIFGEAEGHP